jgi:DnaJ-class molecular chaperone
MSRTDDAYAVLGLTPGASQDEIGRAFRARVRANHPDTRDPSSSGADDRLQQLLAAYALLRDHGPGEQPRRAADDNGPVTVTVRHHDVEAPPRGAASPPLWVGPVRRRR